VSCTNGKGWWDATCVYGYVGPVASHPDVPASVLRSFQAALREVLLERRVVTVFSRLHPLVPQRELLVGLGECIPMGRTVSIDLTLPVELQRAQYRKDYKRQINKLRRLGATCLRDQGRVHLNEFIAIYHETMHRVYADDTYFFDHMYFERLVSVLGSNIQLFICLLENKVICGGLFTSYDGIVQAHLCGSWNEYLGLSPTKLLFDTVRLWANECGARVFHLGGGVRAQEDSVFYFKSGFSNRRHEFAVWTWVLLPDVYDQLCQEKTEWNKRHGLNLACPTYFPAYRCPTCPRMGLD
jgi:lipid II:glycine glycyltransferase (peptidoglycan interpeptide bridge formation enzyme)